jgi:hypothetical protein
MKVLDNITEDIKKGTIRNFPLVGHFVFLASFHDSFLFLFLVTYDTVND